MGIIGRPLGLVRENLIGLLNFDKLLFCGRIAVGVWMVLFSELVVGLFDLRGRGLLRESQGLVRILFKGKEGAFEGSAFSFQKTNRFPNFEGQ